MLYFTLLKRVINGMGQGLALLLFHQLLQSDNKLADDIVLAVTDIPDNAAPDMICDKILIEGIDRSIYCGRLHEDICAVRVIFDHFSDPADLSLDAVQPVDKLFLFFLCAVGGFSAASAFFLFRHKTGPPSNIPYGGILELYITSGKMSRGFPDFFIPAK